MFCFQVVSEDEDFIESGLRNETMAVWSEVTPSGEPDGAFLAAMPAEWQAPLHPIAPIVRQGFDSIIRVVSPRLLSRSPSVAMSRAPSVAGTTDPGSDAVPGTPGSEEPPDSPVDPVDPVDDRPDYWLVCTNFRYGEQCGEATNGNSQFCRNCQLGL
jgi:hypothetical protein